MLALINCLTLLHNEYISTDPYRKTRIHKAEEISILELQYDILIQSFNEIVTLTIYVDP